MSKLLIALQASLFYLIPYFIGSGFTQTLERLKRYTSGREDSNKTLTSLGENFAVGISVVFGLALFVKYILGSIFAVDFQRIYFPLIWILALGGLVLTIIFRGLRGIRAKRPYFIAFGFIILLSVIVYGIWHFKSPYSLNWDYYQHQSLSRLIEQGKFDFFTTKISDTFGFDSYPPTFHLLVSASQYPVRLSIPYILDYWNIIGFYHLLSVGFASYIFGLAISKKKEVGVLSAIVGTITFDSISSFTNLFLLPQTLAAVIFILILSNVIAGGREEAKLPSFWQIVFGVIALSIMHYIVGIFAALILLFSYVYLRFKNQLRSALISFPFIAFIVLAVIFGVFISGSIDLSSINQGEASLYLFDLTEKVEFAQRIYGNALIFFVPLGVIYALSKKKWGYGFATLFLFGFVGILISSFPYVVKFYVLGRFVVHLFIALGIWSLLKFIKFNPLRYLGHLAVAMAFIILLVFNIIYWKNWISFRGEFTHIGQYDIEASEFLDKSYGGRDDVLLISDPATQMIFEGLAGVDSAGGGFMRTYHRSDLYEALNAPSPALARRNLENISDGLTLNLRVKLLAVSGRTFAWKDFEPDYRYRFDSNVWAPEELSYWDNIKLAEFAGYKEGFELIYSSPYVWIFELK